MITGDHPVLTKEGWKQVENLKPGDYVLRVWASDGRKQNRGQKKSKFSCKKCGATVGGVKAWAAHRNACYSDQQVMPELQKAIVREMMRTRNPMKDPAAVKKMRATIKHEVAHRSKLRSTQEHRAIQSVSPQTPFQGTADSCTRCSTRLASSMNKRYILRPDKLLPDSQSRYILDAALPDLKLNFEVDGWWHYNDERIKKRDIARDATLRLNGWRVVRIPGSSIYNHADDIKKLVSAHLNNLEMVNDKQWVRVNDVNRTGQVTTVYGFECIPKPHVRRGRDTRPQLPLLPEPRHQQGDRRLRGGRPARARPDAGGGERLRGRRVQLQRADDIRRVCHRRGQGGPPEGQVHGLRHERVRDRRSRSGRSRATSTLSWWTTRGAARSSSRGGRR